MNIISRRVVIAVAAQDKNGPIFKLYSGMHCARAESITHSITCLNPCRAIRRGPHVSQRGAPLAPAAEEDQALGAVAPHQRMVRPRCPGVMLDQLGPSCPAIVAEPHRVIKNARRPTSTASNDQTASGKERSCSSLKRWKRGQLVHRGPGHASVRRCPQLISLRIVRLQKQDATRCCHCHRKHALPPLVDGNLLPRAPRIIAVPHVRVSVPAHQQHFASHYRARVPSAAAPRRTGQDLLPAVAAVG
mmetsp:Transcript_13029/g.41635  ORF Transcript_13029/g.41635 Transcript_13029/m.41635 type:complete len:246 (-) Transcript_13029:1014-1751(-)